MSEDIIINAVSPRVRYIADGKATSFSFVFPIFSNQDMNVYIDDELITNGYSVVGAGTTEGGEVIFTLDTHSADYLETQEGRRLPVEHCIKGTEGHSLYGETAKAVRQRSARCWTAISPTWHG